MPFYMHLYYNLQNISWSKICLNKSCREKLKHTLYPQYTFFCVTVFEIINSRTIGLIWISEIIIWQISRKRSRNVPLNNWNCTTDELQHFFSLLSTVQKLAYSCLFYICSFLSYGLRITSDEKILWKTDVFHTK
jgi:hypothetical protein